MKSFVKIGVFYLTVGVSAFSQNTRPSSINPLDAAVSFAIRQEYGANHLEQGKEVCVGFSTGMGVDEEKVLSSIRVAGLRVHADEWCNKGPRGMTIEVLSLNRVSAIETYEVVIDVVDSNPIRREGAHFATLLRRGKYTIKMSKDLCAEMLSYEQECCPKPSKGKSEATAGPVRAALN